MHTIEDPDELNNRVGALLFTAAGLARWYKVDAESALRETILRFRHQIDDLESQARDQNRPVNELKPPVLEELWKELVEITYPHPIYEGFLHPQGAKNPLLYLP